MKRLIPAALLLLAATSGFADEGMWFPPQLPQIAQLDAYPMAAVISLGGCTASFVSPQGLVVTNHHCAYGSIQFNSSPQRDLLKNGFLAADFKDELPAAPGTRVFVTESLTDVTAQMQAAAAQATDGAARQAALEARDKALVAACEAEPGRRCRVASFYGGTQYQLIRQMEIRDVRLVYAPPMGVGKFGGDTDNWMWPRHTGDFSFYRAYVGADGKPADFNAANKPYVPKMHLKLASTPLGAGDFVMVAGYPGSTSRMKLPQEAAFALQWEQPARIQMLQQQRSLIEASTAGRRDAQIALASQLAGINNREKNLSGQEKSFAGSDLLARKQRDYDAFKRWVAADAKRAKEYGPAIEATEGLLKQQQLRTQKQFLLTATQPRLLEAARQLYKLAQQRSKPDAERETGFQQRDELRIRQGLQTIERRYDEATDKALVAHFLAQYLAQPAEMRNAVFVQALGLKAGMDEAAVSAVLTPMYSGSQLGNGAERLAWMKRGPAEFEASTDPFIRVAVALHVDAEQTAREGKQLAGDLQPVYAKTLQGLLAWHASRGEAVYPDANGTLRVSFGKVQGRNPGADGASWLPFTTLRGVLDKATGEGEFDAPQAQLQAIRARQFGRYAMKSLDSVPVNFLATLDTTGGNSGSPVFNRKGELVGLLFDGTVDAVIDTWDFNARITRSICLDARYMLWQMHVVDHADRLLKEMGAV